MKASEFIKLKSQITTEMARRNLNGYDTSLLPNSEPGHEGEWGDLSKYSKSDYDFNEVPTKGNPMLLEQGIKVINIAYQIEDLSEDGGPTPIISDTIAHVEEVSKISQMLGSKYSLETMEGTESSCVGACSGLCYGSCIGGCNGCSSGCGGGCSGCTATCGSGCANSLMYA